VEFSPKRENTEKGAAYNGQYLDYYLNMKLWAELSPEDKEEYRNYYILFYLGCKDKYFHENPALTNTSTDNIMIFDSPGEPDATIDHELMHCFKIEHSFANGTFCTYRPKQTENIMDYSQGDGEVCYTTWHWQWAKANGSVKGMFHR
jgi:hypothetical protein